MLTEKKLKLSKQEQTFDLTKTDTMALALNVVKFNQNPRYCIDVMPIDENFRVLERWKCVGGKIAIKIVQDSIGYKANNTRISFTMNMKTANCLVFKKKDGTTVKIPSPVLESIMGESAF